MQLTSYGKSISAGGWDPYGDPETDAGNGDWGLKLTPNACALTDSAALALNAHPGDWVKINLGEGVSMSRQYLDRAPEENMRCDCYEPNEFIPNRPDYADVTLM